MKALFGDRAAEKEIDYFIYGFHKLLFYNNQKFVCGAQIDIFCFFKINVLCGLHL